MCTALLFIFLYLLVSAHFYRHLNKVMLVFSKMSNSNPKVSRLEGSLVFYREEPARFMEEQDNKSKIIVFYDGKWHDHIVSDHEIRSPTKEELDRSSKNTFLNFMVRSQMKNLLALSYYHDVLSVFENLSKFQNQRTKIFLERFFLSIGNLRILGNIVDVQQSFARQRISNLVINKFFSN